MPFMNWTLTALFVVAIPSLAAEPERFILAKPGSIPIILSAPHGGRTALPDVPPRANGGTADFNTVRDENTAELAELIAKEVERRIHAMPYLVIAHFERRFVDVNRSEQMGVESEKAKPYYEAYHRALSSDVKEVSKKWDHGLLLDIHGQGKRPGELARGTNDGQTVESLLKRFGPKALTGPKSLLGAFEGMGYSIFPPSSSDETEDKRFIGGHTVRTYGSHQRMGIDAIQLEFGTDLRDKAKLAKTASAMAESIEIFCRAYLPEAIQRK